jgi:uncharacterized protein
MGLDPGIRTGVKVAVVDATGKLLDTATIYPHEPRNDWDGSLRASAAREKHGVQLIAIGNGTASRETDKLAADLMKLKPELGQAHQDRRVGSGRLGVFGVRTGGEGIPGSRREPARRGVDRPPPAGPAGRTGEDRAEGDRRRPVPARRQSDRSSRSSLDAVVEDCVNAVGVDVNTASAAAADARLRD